MRFLSKSGPRNHVEGFLTMPHVVFILAKLTLRKTKRTLRIFEKISRARANWWPRTDLIEIINDNLAFWFLHFFLDFLIGNAIQWKHEE